MYSKFYSKMEIVLVVLLALVLSHCSKPNTNQTSSVQPAVRVTTVTAVKQDVPLILDVVGIVYPYESVSVKSRIDSQIIGVYFKDGDLVQEGGILFQLDDREYKTQLQQQEATLVNYQAQLDNTKRQLERDRQLAGKGFSSQQQYDASKTAYNSALASVEATKALIENLKVKIDYTTLRSPINGKVGTINITKGNIVKANDTSPLVVINKIQPIRVQMAIPQRYYHSFRQVLSQGDGVVRVKSLNGQYMEGGQLEYMENAIDTTTGTFAARAAFSNQNESLWPGMFINAAIQLGMEKEAIVIPLVAVQAGQDQQSFVFKVTADSKATKIPVELSRQVQEYALIKKGLNPGDVVVTDGFLRLADGAAVDIIAPQEIIKQE